MGTVKKTTYTITIPKNAIVKNGMVFWKSKNETKSGKLSGENKVLCESEIWIAQYIDENGKLKRISTKTKDRSIASRILAKLENEVDQIRAGALSRSQLKQSIQLRNSPEIKILENKRL